MADRTAVHDLLTIFLSYYAGAGGGAAKANLEWEFRFSSFRVFNAKYAPDFALLYDEFASVGAYLQRFGWKLDGRPKRMKRTALPLSTVMNSNGGNDSSVRITEFQGKFEMETKTPYVTSSRLKAVQDLSELLHVRASMQTEKIESGLTQQDIKSRRDRALSDGTATVRDITRTTFVHPDFPSMRIDCSDILMAGGRNSGSPKRSFEIELEILPERIKALTAARIVDALRQIVMGIQFGKFGIMSGPKWKGHMDCLNDRLASSQMRFPQPVSVASVHVDQIIRGEFAVTEKADGKRSLLFLSCSSSATAASSSTSSTRELFRVDFFGRLVPIGLQLAESLHSNISSFLLDVEFIESKNLYLVFDIYFFEGTTDWQGAASSSSCSSSSSLTKEELGRLKFHSVPLLERYKFLNALLSFCAPHWQGKGKDSTRIVLKNMVFPSGQAPGDNRPVFEFIHGVLSGQLTFEYKVEGLLFTHLSATLPINSGSANLSFALPVGTTLSATRWNGAVKFKPPEETTNDFQLGAFEWDEDSKSVFIPLRAYLPSTNQLVPFEGILPHDPLGEKHKFLRIENQQSLSRREVLDPSFVLELGNLQLYEGLIVECAFDLRKCVWVPVRARPDKRFPNSVDVVYANWELIHSPVVLPQTVTQAEDFLRRQEQKEVDVVERRPAAVAAAAASSSIATPAASLLGATTDVYYRELASTDKFTEALREFHNGVKRMALQTCISHFPRQGRRLRLLDLAVGRGGDLRKYLHQCHHLEKVVGVDISSVNLELCCRRFLQMSVGGDALMAGTNPLALDLLHGSSSWSFDDRNLWTANSKFAFSSSSSSTSSSSSLLQSKDLLPEKHSFDIAALHFALHYFWKEEAELDRLLTNVSFALPVGGFFLATCFDGEQVHEYFQRNDALTLHDQESGQIYLQVRPAYDRKLRGGAGHFNEDEAFGFEIQVFNRSINEETTMSEWLVHSTVLRRKMEALGFRLVPLHEFFSRQHSNDFLKPLTRFDQLFWHMYLKWRHHGTPPVIPQDQLMTVCGWNRLFVFQRVALTPIGLNANPGQVSSSLSTMNRRTLHPNTRMPGNQRIVKFANNVHLHAANYYGLTVPLSDVSKTLFGGSAKRR